jgi:dihydroorotase
MSEKILIKNTTIVNEGKSSVVDILIADGLIEQIGNIAMTEQVSTYSPEL